MIVSFIIRINYNILSLFSQVKFFHIYYKFFHIFITEIFVSAMIYINNTVICHTADMKKIVEVIVGVFLTFFPSFHLSPKAKYFNGFPNGQKVEIRTVAVNETVEHLFTHCLISHPEIAFQPNNPYGKHLDRDCLTPKEFRLILSELYQNGYTLVNPLHTFSFDENGAKRRAFSFPKDKKPFILSFDDVVYATKNKGNGLSDKLILKKNGDISAYTETAEPSLHKEEFIPILEEFIEKHPDFSYQNARGILFLTGFDGILGYRTQKDSPTRNSDTEQVKPLVKALKEKGWLFGSHSYAHGHMKTYTPEQMKSDAEKWKNQVEPLVGKTPFYAYPYGEWVVGDDERATILSSFGFQLFFGVGEKPFYSKMPLDESQNKILFQDRCAMDGVSLRNGNCNRFFDAKNVYDCRRPIPLIG